MERRPIFYSNDPIKRIFALTILLMLVSTGMLNVAAMDVGQREGTGWTELEPTDLEPVDGIVTDSRSSMAPLEMPNETLFLDPPKENRVMPIYAGTINETILDHYESIGIGGMVINPWQWNDTTLSQADGFDWTIWVNDYYMYPSGNANKYGGLHETFWNPGFETDSFGVWPDGWIWTYYDWPKFDKSGTQSHSGSNAISVDDYNYMFWPMKVEENWNYTMSAWARGQTGTEAGRFIILWYNIDELINMDITVFQTSNNYDRFSFDVQAPQGANAARLLVMGHEDDKYVWFDDVMFRKTEQLSTNDVINPGVELDVDTNSEPDNWIQQNGATWDNSLVWSHGGAAAVRVNITGSYLQPVSITPGKDYYLGEWVRSETGTSWGQTAVLWLNSTWDIKKFDLNVFLVNDTYTYHELTATAPMNATIGLVALVSGSDSYVYVDDVTFTDLKPLNNGLSRGPVLDGHPELEAQGLYYATEDVSAPGTSALDIPDGKSISIVAAPVGPGDELDLTSAIDVSGSLVGNQVVWTPTSGTWRVMAFTVDILYNGTEVDRSLSNMHQINVMNKVAVQSFINEMYKKTIYDKNSQYWGNMIQASFADEVSNLAGYFLGGQLYPVVAWLEDDVNGLYLTDEFQALHGYDLVQFLPALWNDVGPKTAKYRVDFYNTTGYLQGEAFYKMIGEWCDDRGINFSGHLLAEDSLIQHTAYYGDFFESIKYMGYPGMDTLLHTAGELESDLIVPKMVSSAAALYGKPHVMTEYSVAANSMNLRNMTAVANWEAVQGIDIVTSFSFWVGGPVSDAELTAHSEHIGRTNYMLQQGSYTTDIAVLYPITTIQAEYMPRTDILWNRAVFGGFEHDESFRNLTRSLLSDQLDFIYINDESLVLTNIQNSSGTTILRHDVSGLDLKVLIVPEMDVIETGSMEMVRDFYEAGGIVVAVGDLPTASAENGTDPYITTLVDQVFDTGPVGATGYNLRTNGNGGVSIMGEGDLDPLEIPIRDAMDPDIIITPEDKFVYYMKRTAPGFDMFFLVNNRITDSLGEYQFKALGDPYAWDPETGDVQSVQSSDVSYDPATGYTTIENVEIKGFSSVFLIFKKPVLEIGPGDLVFTPSEALEGENVEISTNISNNGHGIATQVKVRAFDGTPLNGTQIGQTETITIGTQDLENVVFIWDTEGFPHTRNITVEACLRNDVCVNMKGLYFVNTPPWVEIIVDDDEVLTFENVNLTANISDVGYPIQNLSWDLGDGTSTNLTDVVHEYSDDGVYTVTLWVTDANGTTNSSSADITVINRAPKASMEVSPASVGDVMTVFFFNGSTSSDMDGNVTVFEWDFGDNGTGAGVSVNHSYLVPGSYTVSLIVEDDDGAEANTTMNLTTVNLAPVANFTVEPEEGNVTTTFKFRSNSTDLDGKVLAFNWSLGDGTTKTNASFEHSYIDDGKFRVTLKVQDDLGLWGIVVMKEITVSNLPPVASVTPTSVSVKVGEQVNLSATGSTDPDDGLGDLVFVWEWDDGKAPGSGVNVSHTYDTAGDYNITLTLTDDDGATSKVKVPVKVQEAEKPKPRPPKEEDYSGLIAGVILAVIVAVIVLLVVTRLRKGGTKGPGHHVIPHEVEKEEGYDEEMEDDTDEPRPDEPPEDKVDEPPPTYDPEKEEGEQKEEEVPSDDDPVPDKEEKKED